jgi:ribosomal-protein-alanine N-acetyltransferase
MEIRRWNMGDAEELFFYKQRNYLFLSAFQPLREKETLKDQEIFIQNAKRYELGDYSYHFGIFLEKRLIGVLNITNIIRGSFQNGSVGYSIDEKENGKGLMSKALSLGKEMAFAELGLHRLAAAVMPHNVGSIRVLEKNGFKKEGYARRYLKINGIWEDHVLFAALADDES